MPFNAEQVAERDPMPAHISNNHHLDTWSTDIESNAVAPSTPLPVYSARIFAYPEPLHPSHTTASKRPNLNAVEAQDRQPEPNSPLQQQPQQQRPVWRHYRVFVFPESRRRVAHCSRILLIIALIGLVVSLLWFMILSVLEDSAKGSKGRRIHGSVHPLAVAPI